MLQLIQSVPLILPSSGNTFTPGRAVRRRAVYLVIYTHRQLPRRRRVKCDKWRGNKMQVQEYRAKGLTAKKETVQSNWILNVGVGTSDKIMKFEDSFIQHCVSYMLVDAKGGNILKLKLFF